ncbi:MAG: DUF1634 domain-containing protein [Burkholderiales bacterium]|nr:DUF1634 domain-containing protein [Burkholderiales bacterium]
MDRGEYRNAQPEGSPVSPPGRPKGEYRAEHEGTPVGAQQTSSGRPAPGSVKQPPEQQRYATLLDRLTRVGLAVLVLSFAAYLLELMPPRVAPERLPQLWTLPVEQYLQQTGTPVGWGWISLLRHGDVAALSGIVILAGCSALCLGALVPLYLRRRERAFAALCLAEIAVIVLAASGLFAGGH